MEAWALLGGVSRPSKIKWQYTLGTPSCLAALSNISRWSSWLCTPPGDSNPIKCSGLLVIFKVPLGIVEAYKCLKTFKPDIVFSKGGYVSFPVVLAAAKLKIPVILHESDVVPGLANKIMAKFSKKICISFAETKKYFKKHSHKIVLTGNPVRKEILKGNVQKGYKLTGFNKQKPVI